MGGVCLTDVAQWSKIRETPNQSNGVFKQDDRSLYTA